MSIHAKLTLYILLALVTSTAAAQRQRIDDSLSPVDFFAVDLNWSPADMQRALAALLGGADDTGAIQTGRIANVEVRLDTRNYVGRSVRIFLNLPPSFSGLDNPAGFELQWDATDAFLPGSVRPGQSSLVFDGVVDQPVTRAVFSFVFLLEGGTDADVFDVEPFYEIEPNP